MARGINNWSAEDVVRFLSANHFSYNHGRGSHRYYIGIQDGALRHVCVPFHAGRSIKPRTLKAIIGQSGIPKSEWLAFSL